MDARGDGWNSFHRDYRPDDADHADHADHARRASPAGVELKAPRDDFERLEEAVRLLVQQLKQLRAERASLRRDLAARDRTIRDLEERLLAAGQLRHDAIKRIDDLLSQVDNLDAHLAASSVAAGD